MNKNNDTAESLRAEAVSTTSEEGLDPAQRLIEQFRQQERVQAGSLLVSAFGDAVVPRGGRVWLGSLIRLLEPLGLSERLVRTAVFRLVRDDWLARERVGRRTDYLLTAAAERRIEEAAAHIYAAVAPDWDRRWRLILVIGEVTGKERERLRKTLGWQGFGLLNGDCFIHPSADLIATFDALASEGLAHLRPRLKPLIAADVSFGAAASDQAVVAAAWDFGRLAVQYSEFVQRYQAVLASLRAGNIELTDEVAFLLRLLLIHDYRHLLLRDPVLPEVLLPADWPGQAARLLCRELYRRLLSAAERHLDQCFKLADDSTPTASAELDERFREHDPLMLSA